MDGKLSDWNYRAEQSLSKLQMDQTFCRQQAIPDQ